MWTVNYTVSKPGLTESNFASDRVIANTGSGYLEKLQALQSAGVITGVSTNYSTNTAMTTTTWASSQAHDSWTSELTANSNWSKFRTNLSNMGYTTYIAKGEL